MTTDTIRVARTLAHGRDAAALAEDLPYLRKVKEAIELAQFIVEGALPFVHSKEGRAMVQELSETLPDIKHDASVSWVVQQAEDAFALVGTMNIRRPQSKEILIFSSGTGAVNMVKVKNVQD